VLRFQSANYLCGYPQPTTSGLLCRRAVATDSNFGLEERKRRGLEI
jgi:hypothetical protein